MFPNPQVHPVSAIPPWLSSFPLQVTPKIFRVYPPQSPPWETLPSTSCKDHHPSLQTAPCGRQPQPRLGPLESPPEPLSVLPEFWLSTAQPSCKLHQPHPPFRSSFFPSSLLKGGQVLLVANTLIPAPGSRRVWSGFPSIPGRALRARRVREASSGAGTQDGSGSHLPICAPTSLSTK